MIMKQNLRSLLVPTAHMSQAVSAVARVFGHIFTQSTVGSLAGDILSALDPDQLDDRSSGVVRVLTPDELQAIRSLTSRQFTRSLKFPKLTIKGTVFQPRTTSRSDCLVALRDRGDSGWVPAEIQEILVLLRDDGGPVCDHVLLVHEYEPLEVGEQIFDYWRHLGPYAGRVHRMRTQLRAVFSSAVICSMACTEDVCEGIAEPHAHFLPHDRVSVYP